MTSSLEEIDRLDGELAALESGFADATQLAAVFGAELKAITGNLDAASKGSSNFSSALDRGLKRAFDDLIFEGANLSDVLQNLGQSMISRGFEAAVSPVTDAISGGLAKIVSGFVGVQFAFADGAAFAGGRVTPFAKGGVVSQATMFPMRGATGLMGEAGPEAIMPLARGTDGALGIRAEGASRAPVHVTMNISTPDVQGFQRSKAQVAAKLQSALAAGQKHR